MAFAGKSARVRVVVVERESVPAAASLAGRVFSVAGLARVDERPERRVGECVREAREVRELERREKLIANGKERKLAARQAAAVDVAALGTEAVDLVLPNILRKAWKKT